MFVHYKCTHSYNTVMCKIDWNSMVHTNTHNKGVFSLGLLYYTIKNLRFDFISPSLPFIYIFHFYLFCRLVIIFSMNFVKYVLLLFVLTYECWR